MNEPCACCGRAATSPPHHMETRGRRPDLVDDPENVCPICVECHNRCEPTGSWRVRREGDFWVTTDIQTGEEISRRPVEPRGVEIVTQIQRASDILDPRTDRAQLLAFLFHLSDFDLDVLDKVGAAQAKNGARLRALCHYAAWQRWPYKEGRAEALAFDFGIAPSTIWENVRAATMFAEDTGPALDWSYYTVACHAPEPQAALEMAHEMRASDPEASIQTFRVALRQTQPSKKETCPTCGRVWPKGKDKGES